jgi:membrane associated rhomboid family serine protease
VISLRLDQGEETIPLEEFEARVRQGLIEPHTPVRFPILTGDRWVDARELDLFRRLYAPARIHFARSFSLGRFPTVTAVLALLQIVLYFAIAGAHRALPPDPLIDAGAKVQPNVLELGETWRLLTANLLHRDVLHVLFNMFFLFNVGGAIENIYRLEDYALILLVSALATTTLSTMM